MVETLGDLGDFLGGIGVIVTLLYLATQVRQNTKLLRAQAMAATAQAGVSFNNLLGTHPAAARVFQVGLERFNDLSEEEQRQFINLLRAMFTGYQHTFHQFEDGLVDESIWDQDRRAALSALSLPHLREWWENRKVTYTPRFVAALEESPPGEVGVLAGDVISAMASKAPSDST